MLYNSIILASFPVPCTCVCCQTSLQVTEISIGTSDRSRMGYRGYIPLSSETCSSLIPPPPHTHTHKHLKLHSNGSCHARDMDRHHGWLHWSSVKIWNTVGCNNSHSCLSLWEPERKFAVNIMQIISCLCYNWQIMKVEYRYFIWITL